MKARFRADHIGSLKRPAALLEEVRRIYASAGHAGTIGRSIQGKDLTRLHQLEDEAIRRVVARQEEIGLQVITDGEFRRIHYFNSFYSAVEGVEGKATKLRFRDDDGTYVENSGSVGFTGRLRKIGSPAASEAKFLAGLTDRTRKITFPGASFLVAQILTSPAALNAYNNSVEQASAAISALLGELVRDAIAAGANYVQFDESGYLVASTGAYKDVAAMIDVGQTKTDMARVLKSMLDADRKVIEGLPAHVTTGLHTCRGNYASRYLVKDDHMRELDEAYFALPYDRFTFEWHGHVARTEGDYKALERVPHGGPVIVLGVVSTRHQAMEKPEDIIATVKRAARHIPLDQLAISPHCGFASGVSTDGSGPDGNLIDEDTQWRKLALLVNAAREIWGDEGNASGTRPEQYR